MQILIGPQNAIGERAVAAAYWKPMPVDNPDRATEIEAEIRGQIDGTSLSA